MGKTSSLTSMVCLIKVGLSRMTKTDHPVAMAAKMARRR